MRELVMNAQITLTLPEDVLRRAEWLAQRTGRTLADILTETIELSLNPLGTPTMDRPITTWSDEEVLAAADREMAAADDQRLSELLYRQQAEQLTGAERAELSGLMALYQEGLLRKAQALREAVQRGLRGPLQP
jgi:hypothetical protein